MPGTDRRSSTSSEDASLPLPRQMLADGSELIPTRTTKPVAPKPAANPLQFIKVGPCDLYKAAQEQLKKVEEIKKVEKTVKEDSEDWQSNLDNWKCSRRKRQEHIIDRVVEVKKLELEEHERNKRRGKTLSEMIQERSDKGVGPRRVSLMSYPDEDPSDLTDLGISPDKNEQQTLQETENNNQVSSNSDIELGDSSTLSTELKEITYESAIEGYRSYAEKNVKKSSKPRLSPPKPGSRIGEKVEEFEQVVLRSNSVTDVNIIKVNVDKRRSLFEVVESADTKSPSAERIAKELGDTKIVKQRLSSFENQLDAPQPLANASKRELDSTAPAIQPRQNVPNELHYHPPTHEDIPINAIKDMLSPLDSGCKESVFSNCSDEELGHKELISPSVSDREISSPLVSDNNALTHNEKLTIVGNGNTNTLIDGYGDCEVGDGMILNSQDSRFLIDNHPEESISTIESITPHLCSKLSYEQIICDIHEDKSEKCQNSDETSMSLDQFGETTSISKNGEDVPERMKENAGLRTRKLTPMLPSLLLPLASPKITDARQQMLLLINEDDAEDTAPLTVAAVQGAETSESGIDMEESSLYTDENIDEVLGDDEGEYESSRDPHDDVPDSASDLHRMRRLASHLDDEAVTRFDEDSNDTKEIRPTNESMARLDQLLATTKSLGQDHLSITLDASSQFQSIDFPQDDHFSESESNSVNNNQMIGLSANSKVVPYPLSPMSNVEPPKEKPPPPPIDLSEEEEEDPQPVPKTSVRRMDSTKRIKKEIRKKRSDFLGIEGVVDDVKPDVEPPPDLLLLLEEERRLDQQLYRQSISSEAELSHSSHLREHNVPPCISDNTLYRQSICSETDSNHETTESRDSGVELDRGTGEDLCWNKSSPSHCRQDSEIYAHSNGDDDEIAKKEREIIEVLENEEKWRHGKSTSSVVIHETLSEKLRLLEEEKMRLEWARAEEEGRRMADEERLLAKETLLRQQEKLTSTNQAASDSEENLRNERERLEKEQLELVRVRQDLFTQKRPQGPIGTNLRYSMPNLQDAAPAPPLNPRTSSSWSRIHSAENLLDHPSQPQLMSRTALHALSATPRPRIVNGETWIQPKRKADAPKGAYNYQHWLIQEAEHRRITEQQQRAVHSRRSLPIQPRPPVCPATTVPHRPLSTHVPSVAPTHPIHHNIVGLPPAPYAHPHHTTPAPNKPIPDAIIHTLTQRVHNKTQSPKRRPEDRQQQTLKPSSNCDLPYNGEQERMLSVSGKKKCSHCGDELGRGAAMVIESLRLFYHIDCFKCCVCHSQLGDGLIGTDVRVRNNKLHCHNCYSSDDGVKFSCV